jgi:hypothetical protein
MPRPGGASGGARAAAGGRRRTRQVAAAQRGGHEALADDAPVVGEAVALLPNVAALGVGDAAQHVQVVLERVGLVCGRAGGEWRWVRVLGAGWGSGGSERRDAVTVRGAGGGGLGSGAWGRLGAAGEVWHGPSSSACLAPAPAAAAAAAGARSRTCGYLGVALRHPLLQPPAPVGAAVACACSRQAAGRGVIRCRGLHSASRDPRWCGAAQAPAARPLQGAAHLPAGPWAPPPAARAPAGEGLRTSCLQAQQPGA